jgi:hypothetical protein
VHGDVDGAHDEVPVDLLEKRALPAELGEVTLPSVTRRLNADQLNVEVVGDLEQ